MSIRFNCAACRAVLKLEAMIADEKKVRCTQCNMVLLVGPDPANPTALKAIVPDLSAKRDLQIKAEKRREQLVTYGVAAFVGVMAIGVIVWNLLPAPDRAAIEGTVTLDTTKVQAGKITFIGIDNPAITVTTDIVDGNYTFGRKQGPAIGKNKIQISVLLSTGEELVDKRYGAESELTYDIKPGTNRRDFYPMSKDAVAAAPPAGVQ